MIMQYSLLRSLLKGSISLLEDIIEPSIFVGIPKFIPKKMYGIPKFYTRKPVKIPKCLGNVYFFVTNFTIDIKKRATSLQLVDFQCSGSRD